MYLILLAEFGGKGEAKKIDLTFRARSGILKML